MLRRSRFEKGTSSHLQLLAPDSELRASRTSVCGKLGFHRIVGFSSNTRRADEAERWAHSLSVALSCYSTGRQIGKHHLLSEDEW